LPGAADSAYALILIPLATTHNHVNNDLIFMMFSFYVCVSEKNEPKYMQFFRKKLQSILCLLTNKIYFSACPD